MKREKEWPIWLEIVTCAIAVLCIAGLVWMAKIFMAGLDALRG